MTNEAYKGAFDFLMCIILITSETKFSFTQNYIYPEWKMIDYFIVDVTQFVFFVDSDESAQPMTFHVEHPIEIDFHFNSIALQKGLLAY